MPVLRWMLVTASLGYGSIAGAQTSGPTNPVPPPNPQAQSSTTIVATLTENECRMGWNPMMKWTKEDFDTYCAMLQGAK